MDAGARRSEDTRALPVEQVIGMFLTGALRFSDVTAVEPYLQLIGWEADCWRCNASESMSAWHIDEVGRTACGLPAQTDTTGTIRRGSKTT